MKRRFRGRNVTELSNKQWKRLITQSVEAACQSACSSVSGSLDQGNVSLNSGTSIPTQHVGNNSISNINCMIDNLNAIEKVVQVDELHPEHVSCEYDNLSVAAMSNAMACTLSATHESVSSIPLDSDKEALSQDDINTGHDVFTITSSSFDDFMLMCDECDRCAICVCLLSCGTCKHKISLECVHCSNCAGSCDNIDFNSDQDSDDAQTSLRNDLADWAVNGNITHANLRSLLSILNYHHPEDELPKDPRTLVGTRREIKTRPVPPGHYWHNGIKCNLIRSFADADEQEILLTFNMDGVPISTSSRSTLWPILCSVKGSDKVFVVGIYHGYGKPDSGNEYLEEMVQELSDLCLNGLDIGVKHFPISLYYIVCDAPAKALVLNVKNHNGYYSCCKCDQRGKMYGQRMSFPETEGFMERTDDSFMTEAQPDHHKGKTIITTIPGIKPVTSFVLDPMHLLYIGVTKKLLLCWLFGNLNVKMGKHICDEISSMLCGFAHFIPIEFVRKPRALEYVRT